MTPEQESTFRYLIEYRNPDGSLLLSQFGGCWHEYQPHEYWCSHCKRQWRDLLGNPNLATPDGFFALWNAMQAREDWADLLWIITGGSGVFTKQTNATVISSFINPLTFPATVEAFLKGLER